MAQCGAGEDAFSADTAKIPIIIGVVGKNNLFDDHGAAGVIATELLAFFKTLNELCPRSPKLVLTALAPGADHVAAWAALKANENTGRDRRNAQFRVIAPLPFERPVYEQDFRADHARHLAHFSAILDVPDKEPGNVSAWWSANRDDDAQISAQDREWFVLPPLKGADPQKMWRREDGTSGPHRALHYEQTGLWFADRCHFLIAIGDPEEKTNKIGGTVRTRNAKAIGRVTDSCPSRGATLSKRLTELECNRAPEDVGQADDGPSLDPLGQRFRHLSLVLQDVESEAVPDRGAVVGLWRKGRTACWFTVAGSQVTQFPRIAMRRQMRRAGPPWDTFELVEAFNGQVSARWREKLECDRLHCEHWLSNGEAIDEDAFRSKLPGNDRMRRRLGEIIKDWRTETNDVLLARLVWYRRVMSNIQQEIDRNYKNAALWIAGLFILSVTLFTLYAKIYAKYDAMGSAMIAGYLSMAGAAGLVVLWLNWRRLGEQRWIYRAIAEAVRVQIAWRLGGFTERVEQHYSRGAAGVLGRVRNALLGINVAAELAAVTQAGNHRANLPKPEEHQGSVERNWLLSQADYFERKAKAKRENAHRRKFAAGGVFLAALGLAAALLATHLGALWFEHSLSAFLAGTTVNAPMPETGGVILVVALSITFALMVTGANFMLAPDEEGSGDGVDPEAGQKGDAATVIWQLRPFLLGVLRFAIGAGGFALFCGVEALQRWPGGESFAVSASLGAAIAVVLLSAFAGALNYLLEKSAVEAEAGNYADMWPLCRDYHEMYCAQQDSKTGRRQVLHRFGILALEENAAWLRAHRERPLEPIAGG